MHSAFFDMSHCSYTEGFCILADETAVSWEVKNLEAAQLCPYLKIGEFSGSIIQGIWLSDDQNLAISFKTPKDFKSCSNKLKISEQGYGISKEIYIGNFSTQLLLGNDEN
jgi:hypothetical protein